MSSICCVVIENLKNIPDRDTCFSGVVRELGGK
jgi:hypothetical protein